MSKGRKQIVSINKKVSLYTVSERFQKFERFMAQVQATRNYKTHVSIMYHANKVSYINNRLDEKFVLNNTTVAAAKVVPWRR